MTLNQLQDFYKQTIKTNTGAGAGNIYVSTKPNVANGYLVISPTNASLRELIRYTGTGSDGGGDYVTIANISDRGLGGTVAQVHTAGESIRMNMTAEHWADLITELTTLTSGFIEKDAPYNEVQDIIDYINNIAIAGAPDASTSTKGIVEIATDTEINNGTATGSTGAVLSVTPDKLATSKYNEFKSEPSATNEILTENEIYTDGISATQATDNASIVFGENDASGKKVKVYQSFKATEGTIKSIVVKKNGAVATAVDLASMTYAESDFNNNSYTDAGMVSGSRRITKINADGSAGWAQHGEIRKTITGLTNGVTYYIMATLETTVGGTLTCQIKKDSTTLRTISTSNGAQTPYVDSFVASGTSHDVVIGLYDTSADVSTGQLDVSSLIVTTSQNIPLSDITLNLYADNAGNPNTGASLGSKTITWTVWNATAAQTEITFTLASPITVTNGNTYWLELSLGTPSATQYAGVRTNSAGGYTDGAPKSWNTAQGFTAETGDLYFKVLENPSTKLVGLDTNAYVPMNLLDLATIQAIIPVASNNVKKLSSITKVFNGSASTPDTVVKSMTVYVTGIIRVSITTAPNASSNYPYAIFKNGVNVANWTYASGTADEVRTQDISVAYGDSIQFVFKGGGGNYSGIVANFKAFSIAYDMVQQTIPTITLE